MTSIIQFADVHFGVEDQDALSMINDVIEDMSPDVCIISGDITQTGSHEEFEAAHNWIKSLPGKIVATPGNHDTPMFNLPVRMLAPFQRYERYISPVVQPSYQDSNVIIRGINTARGVQAKLDWSLGVVDLDDLDAIIENFEEVPDQILKMVICHHPFIYPDESELDGETKNGVEALERFSDGNIDAVLSGHVHIPFVKHRWPDTSKLLEIGAGTLSTRGRGRPASFNHISISDTELVITLVEWKDNQYARSELHSIARTHYGGVGQRKSTERQVSSDTEVSEVIDEDLT